jgi:hypothetical protein
MFLIINLCLNVYWYFLLFIDKDSTNYYIFIKYISVMIYL